MKNKFSLLKVTYGVRVPNRLKSEKLKACDCERGLMNHQSQGEKLKSSPRIPFYT